MLLIEKLATLGVDHLFISLGIFILLYAFGLTIDNQGKIAYEASFKTVPFLLGVVCISLGGCIMWLPKTGEDCPDKAPCKEKSLLGSDPDRTSLLEQTIVINNKPLNDAQRDMLMHTAKAQIRDSVQRRYNERGLTADLLKAMRSHIDTFFWPQLYRECCDARTNQYSITFQFFVEPKPQKWLHGIKLPQTGDANQPQPNLPLSHFFPKGNYKLSPLQRFNISLIANQIWEKVEAGKMVELYCHGFSSPSPYLGEATYVGTGHYSPKKQPIDLSHQDKFPAISGLDNDILSYARAYEGIQCMRYHLKNLDYDDKLRKYVKFFYVGNGVDASLKTDAEKQRIQFSF